MKIDPYLFFNGRCEEAIEFYRSALGASAGMLMRFNASPEPPGMPLPPGWGEKVMHATIQVGQTTVLVSDGMSDGAAEFGGFSLSIELADADSATRAFNALAEGGQVRMPLEKTFWAPLFGMVVDRFGVSWMVGIPGPNQP